MIGIVGGMGPHAGLDLVAKILRATPARSDREHLPLTLISTPHRIPDRTAFLLGHEAVNPGVALAEIALRLGAAGASVVGIPCNTAHAPPIYRVVEERVAGQVELVHMVTEVALALPLRHPDVRRVGILSTTGTRIAGTYTGRLGAAGYEVVEPPRPVQDEHVMPAIYDAAFGLKAVSDPPHPQAESHLRTALGSLVDRGAEVVVLACTEIPLALRDSERVPLLDATEVLAEALVRQSLAGPGVPQPVP